MDDVLNPILPAMLCLSLPLRSVTVLVLRLETMEWAVFTETPPAERVKG